MSGDENTTVTKKNSLISAFSKIDAFSHQTFPQLKDPGNRRDSQWLAYITQVFELEKEKNPTAIQTGMLILTMRVFNDDRSVHYLYRSLNDIWINCKSITGVQLPISSSK